MSPAVDPGGVITTVHLILRNAHITAGTFVLLCGVAAMSLPKGARWHRLSGNVFFVSMLVLAGTGIVISILTTPNAGNIVAGAMTLYMVATAWATVIRPAGIVGAFEKILALIGFLGTGTATVLGILAAHNPWGHFAGYPPVFYFVFSGIAALATALDIRMILRGGLTGTPRLARHLWRMSFAFFGATGSFFFGQPDFVPAIMKETRLYIVAGLLPLGLMIFWLVRVRVRPIQW